MIPPALAEQLAWACACSLTATLIIYALLCVANRSKLRRKRESAVQRFLLDE